MITKYKSYPIYNDSKVSWIGEIPSGWKISKLKFQTSINKHTLSENTDPLYEIQYIDIGNVSSNGQIGELQKYYFEQAPSRARRIVKNGDTLISTVRTYLKAITSVKEAPNNLICSTGFAVLTPKKSINSLYLSYLIRSDIYIDEIVSRSTGVSYPAINASEIGDLECILPDLIIQESIGKFLEKKSNDIDILVANKQKLIKLLEEKRQSIITETVTKGLIPNVKMKNSDVEWIGEIPEHWMVNKIKRVVDILTCGYASTPAYVDKEDGIPFLSAQNVSKSGKLVLDKYNYISHELHSSLIKNKKPLKGDILQVRVGAGIGQTCIVDVDFEFSIYVSLTHIRPSKVIHNRFLKYLLSSKKFNEFANMQTLQAGGVGNLNVSDLEKSKIPYPNLQEQIEISDYLDQQLAEVEGVIEKLKNQIQKIKEYHQSLIYEAVTGKIDVREFEVVS